MYSRRLPTHPQGNRRKLGQWFTPPEVVDLLLSVAVGCGKPRGTFLDPSCGDGAFLDGLVRRGVSAKNIVGIDLDPVAARDARERIPGARIEVDNFITREQDAQFEFVVGNPPYVRHERLSTAEKKQLRKGLSSTTPDRNLCDLVLGQGDLAAAFLLRALTWLRPGGKLAFVVSHSMFLNEYAKHLWRAVAPLAKVELVLDAPQERWFSEAAVNTAIVVVERTPSKGRSSVTVASLLRSTDQAVIALEGGSTLSEVAEVRAVQSSSPIQWGRGLRTSSTWRRFEKAAVSKMVALSEVAEIKRGVTSGANKLFYMSRAAADDLKLEQDVLWPLLPSAKEACSDPILVRDTDQVAVVVPPGKESLRKYPRVAQYFERNVAESKRKTLQARPFWWSLTVHPARIFLSKAYDQRFAQRLSTSPIVADQRAYAVFPKFGVSLEKLATVLNSTLTAFALESLGRAAMGEGALEWTVADIKELPILDPRLVSLKATEAFRVLAERRVASVQKEALQADRAALDEALLGPSWKGPPLSDVHGALIASVERRTNRGKRRE